MDRRTVLALVAGLPALIPTATEACMIAPVSTDYIERQNARVRLLFDAWWARDLDGFRRLFTEPVGHLGTPIDPAIVRSFRSSYSLPQEARALFGRFFTNRRLSKQIYTLINTEMGVIVQCGERDESVLGIVNCSDAGQAHMFHVGMSGINPNSLTYITSAWQGEDARTNVWPEDRRRFTPGT
jgi:hypothetical protein